MYESALPHQRHRVIMSWHPDRFLSDTEIDFQINQQSYDTDQARRHWI